MPFGRIFGLLGLVSDKDRDGKIGLEKEGGEAERRKDWCIGDVLAQLHVSGGAVRSRFLSILSSELTTHNLHKVLTFYSTFFLFCCQ